MHPKLRGIALLAALASCADPAAPGPRSSMPERTAPLVSDGEVWVHLPANTIALTYDDGPDTYSLQLAQYLHDQGIPATFFLVGCRFQGQPTDGSVVCAQPSQFPASILGQYVALGHRIANHSLHHWDMSALSAPVLHDELAITQAILDPYITDGIYLFRAPGHAWSGASAQAVRQYPDLDRLWGSFMGGIDQEDWSCASPTSGSHPGLTPEACAQLYLNAINGSGTHGGVIQLHDRYTDNVGSDYALRMTQALVSGLRADTSRNYTFVLLGETGNLVIDPATVVGGTVTQGRVEVAQPAGPSGVTFQLASQDTAHATVPSTVTVPPGARSAVFPITTYRAASSTKVAISSSASGSTIFTEVTVTPGVVLPSPVIAPATTSVPPLGGIAFTASGGSGSGYGWSFSVNASGGTIVATTGQYVAGPVGGVTDVVRVTDSAGTTATRNVAVTAGLSITPPSATVLVGGTVPFAASGGSGTGLAWSIPTNASGATIGAATGAYVAGSGTGVDQVQVTDSLGNVASAAVTVTTVPVAALGSLTLAPASVAGGTSSTGTVTLTAAAPTGGAVVALASSVPAAATVPASVTVPAGATSATFTVGTLPVASAATVTVAASYAGVTRSASLAVAVPAGTSRTFGYATLTGFAYASYMWPLANTEMVQPASLTEAGVLTALRTYLWDTGYPPGPTMRVRGLIYADGGGSPGALLAVTPEVTNIVAGAWRDLPLATPVALAPGTYWIGIWSDSSQDGLTRAGPTRYKTVTYSPTGSPQAPWNQNGNAGTTGAMQRPIAGVYTPAAAAVTVTSLAVAPSSVAGGSPATGTVTLSAAAPAGGASVALTSGNAAAATVPATVTIAAGATSATFAVTTLAVAASTSVTLTAAYGGTSASATLAVAAAPPTLASLSLLPSTVTGGTASTGTVVLSAAAPAGGASVALASSYTAVATVPATVTVPAGTTTGSFTVATVAVASDTSATVTATFGGASRSAVLGVTAPPSLSALAIAPASVTGGSGATGTVTLTSAAPAGGAPVALGSSNGATATVPPSVVVPAGATTASFPVTTSASATDATATITASYGGAIRASTLAVTATPPGLVAVSVSAASVLGGTPVDGTVTLSLAAPAGGVTVTLASSNGAAAAIPPSVVVPAGATTATFPVTTSAVAASTPVTLTASLAGVQRTASLTVTPVPALASVGVAPAAVTGGTAATGTVTLTAPAPAGGAAVALAASDPAVVTVPALVTVPAGATSATFAVGTQVVLAPASVSIGATYGGVTLLAALGVNPLPVLPTLTGLSLAATTVVGGTPTTGTITLSIPAPAGGSSVALASSSAVATVPATVTVPAGATSATFTVTTVVVASATAVSITASYGATTLAAALAVTPVVALPSLASLSLAPATVVGGMPSTGRVTLSSIAPAGGATVALSSGSTSIATVPASVTVPAGTTTATFPVATAVRTSSTTVTISASYRGVTRRATLTVRRIAVASLGLSPAAVQGGSPSTGTVTLNVAAPTAGFAVTLASSMVSAATVPASVTVPAGTTAATFPVATLVPATQATPTISATGGGATVSAVLTVTPPPGSLASLAMSPATVTGGASSTGTVTLTSAAPAGGVLVTLSSNAAAVTVPASVTVAEGAVTATFVASTTTVAASVSATLAAVAAGVTRTATLGVQPAVPADPRTFGFSTLDGFGYTGHNWPLVNNEQVQPATLTEAGLLTAIRTFFWDIGNPPGSAMRVRAIIYADAGGAPGELIAVTPEVTDFVAASWRDFPLTTPVALPPGTYWIGIWGNTSQDAYSIPGVNRYKPLTYSATGAPQNPWNQDGNPGVDGAVNRPVCGVYTPLN